MKLIVLVATLLARDALAYQCTQTHQERHVLAAAAVLPPDGGIVVGTVTAEGAGAPAAVTTANTSAVELAPGLIVYRASDRTKPIVVGPDRATFADSYGAELAPPSTLTVTVTDELESASTHVDVALGAPAPKGAVAMVLYDRKGRARSWGPVVAGATSVKVYDDRCARLPAGMIEPSAGDHVTVAWIDAAGRPSPRSADVVVH